MPLFRLDASIRRDGSASRELADVVESQWRAIHPHDLVTTRNIGLEPLPPDAWMLALAGGALDLISRSESQHAAIALAAQLTDDLDAADALIVAASPSNYGVSQHLKAWFDLIITDPRGGPEGEPLLNGKPVVLVAGCNGARAGDEPRATWSPGPWDHATPYAAHILGDLWGGDLTIVERDRSIVGGDASEDPLGERARRAALDAAAVAGVALARHAALAAT